MFAACAREIADDVLFPAALEVDRADRVPVAHLDLLAAEGFYGVAARDDLDFAGMAAIVETLAGGCLTTTFVWLQHHSPVLALVAAPPGPRSDAWLPALTAGERRAGLGLAGLRNPTNPLRVRPTDGGYVLDGSVPWVTGWDMIDTVYLAAIDDHEVIHFLLVDAVAASSLTVVLQQLVAVQASRTVDLTFTDHHVSADRLLSTQPYAEWRAGDAPGSSLNGFLALGVVDRCVRLLHHAAARVGWATAEADLLVRQADDCRAALLAADAAGTPAARATASALAWRAAAQLMLATGARAVRRDEHAQRLLREAAFLLVFGSRPAMRDDLRSRLLAIE
jgi:alkylation response protein AidB-like acyl-CoA dehydrogenase